MFPVMLPDWRSLLVCFAKVWELETAVCKDRPNRLRSWMRRSSLELWKARKENEVKEYKIVKTKTYKVLATQPTVLRNAYLDGVYRSIGFASVFPEHCPWLPTTHYRLIETSCSIMFNKSMQSLYIIHSKALQIWIINNDHQSQDFMW